MQIWAETGKSALPIHNYSQILYQFLTFTQNLKRSLVLLILEISAIPAPVGNSLIFYIDVVRSDSKYIIENVAYL